MPLNTAPKAASAVNSTQSRVISRPEVSVARPTASTARVEALKAKLSAQPPAQPIAPRPAGSSARREEMAKLQKFQTPVPQAPAMPARTSARALPGDLAAIEAPPSGLAPGQAAPVQPQARTEAPGTTAEANSEPLSPEFAALARRERQLRKSQQELKAAQDAWKQDQGKYVPRERLTSETLKVLAEAGITPDKLVELQINQAAPPDPSQKLQEEIAALKAQLNQLVDPENGTLAQRDKQAYEQAVSQIRSDAKLLVESNPAYETIKSEGRTEDVVELITSVFNEDGTVLDVEEAASLLEAKLVERLYKQYERIGKYEKLKAKLRESTESAEANPAQPTHAPTLNTLTNAGSSTRPLTPREKAVLRVQAAINVSKGNK